VIVRAAEQMPGEVSVEAREEAVSALVRTAVEQRLNTKTLRRRARRVLDVVNRAYADRHEAGLVAAEERYARNETWMVLGDNGDGTWTARDPPSDPVVQGWTHGSDRDSPLRLAPSASARLDVRHARASHR
jgi:hypothetical protein